VNKKRNNPQYKELYDLVCRKYRKIKHLKHGPFDETYFTLRVFESAKLIIDKIDTPIDKELVLVATLVHDLGKTKLDMNKVIGEEGLEESATEEWDRHPELGVDLARELLTDLKYSDTFIEKVCYLVKYHDARSPGDYSKSIELKVLQDADLLADIGFASFVRPFLFSGKFSSKSIIDSIRYIQNEDRTKDGEDINLEVTRVLANRALKTQQKLADKMAKEIESELLVNTWEFETRDPYYSLFREGEKTYEGRTPDLNNSSKRYDKCQVGDKVKIIKVYPENSKRIKSAEILEFKVVDVKVYRDLDVAFQEFNYKLLDPLVESADSLKNTILGFPGYKERIKENGFYLIKLERVE
jgi:HD superfamily phosphodiesterase/ASC-1-like (ASCH) protein